MFHQSHHLAKKHTVHLSYVMFYSSAYEDAAEWCMQDKRKNIKNEQPAATWSQGFFCCLMPPQTTLFFSLLLKTKVQHREIKNAIWSSYFQVSGSSILLVISSLIPGCLSSHPCHVLSLLPTGHWLPGLCLHSLHAAQQLKPCPRRAGCRQFPLNTLPVQYLQISLFVIGPPRGGKLSIRWFQLSTTSLFQLLFLSLLSSSHYFSLSIPFPGPLFPWASWSCLPRISCINSALQHQLLRLPLYHILFIYFKGNFEFKLKKQQKECQHLHTLLGRSNSEGVAVPSKFAKSLHQHFPGHCWLVGSCIHSPHSWRHPKGGLCCFLSGSPCPGKPSSSRQADLMNPAVQEISVSSTRVCWGQF